MQSDTSVAPFSEDQLPAVQGRHTLAVEPPRKEEYVPALHWVQRDGSVRPRIVDHVPCGQELQVDEPLDDHKPALQLMQKPDAEAPGRSVQVPALHKIQSDGSEAPRRFDHVPALHATHCEESVALAKVDHVPAAQPWHDDEPVVDHNPALQVLHCVCVDAPMDRDQSPALHAVHDNAVEAAI